jgi:hypothetical protein
MICGIVGHGLPRRDTHAECIVDALSEYEARLESEGESVVLVSALSSGGRWRRFLMR